MGGYSYPTQIPENFRLRRAKNRVFCVFEAKNFPPAAGQKSCVVCFPNHNFPACGGHTTKCVPGEFLRAQGRASTVRKNNLAAAWAQFLVFSRVQERASTIRKNDLDYVWQPCRGRSWRFHECRNALLPFVKRSRFWQPRRRSSQRFHECRNALLPFAKLIQHLLLRYTFDY